MLKRRRGMQPGLDYVEDHVANAIYDCAQRHWPKPPGNNASIPLQQADSIIRQIYSEQLLFSGFAHRRAMLLELSRYLENYLWPAFDAQHSSKAHIISIAAMLNEKCRERVPAWQVFHKKKPIPVSKGDDAAAVVVWDSTACAAWQPAFALYFERVLHMLLQPAAAVGSNTSSDPSSEESPTLLEKSVLLIFLTHCFDSLAEENGLWEQVKRLLTLRLWTFLHPQRLQFELAANPRYAARYNALLKHDKQSNAGPATEQLHAKFLPQFLDQFVELLQTYPREVATDSSSSALLLHYLERFVQFLIDLECMLPSRRYFNTLLDDRHVLALCKQSDIYQNQRDDNDGGGGQLFRQLVTILEFYVGFEIDEVSGEALTDKEVDRRHCMALHRLQLYLFQEVLSLEGEEETLSGKQKLMHDRLHEFCVANVASVETESGLSKFLSPLSHEQLYDAAAHLALVPKRNDDNEVKLLERYSKAFLLHLLVNRHRKRPSQLQYLNSLALYPTEEVIWDENRVPVEYYSGEEVLALPKLNLQFLTLHDYLLRNFDLFRLESTFEIRQDIEDSVRRMRPWKSESGDPVFSGWSRMALPIQNFTIIEVAAPHLGDNHPSRVRADVTIAVNLRREIGQEWDNLRRYDPCFLITVRPQMDKDYKFDRKALFVPQVGLLYVRGCEIEGLLDTDGKVITDEERRGKLAQLKQSQTRTYRVKLDPCQYQQDVNRMQQCADATMEDVYDTFNILLRRKPKENNFKAVLETIRELMNTYCVVPDWLHNLLLGYQDPSAAHYSQRLAVYEPRQDWRDTFLSAGHLLASFPQYDIQFVDRRRRTGGGGEEEPSSGDHPPPPYRLLFPPIAQDPTLSRATNIDEQAEETLPSAVHVAQSCRPVLQAEAYSPSLLSALVPEELLSPTHTKWGNQVQFTPTQAEAIRSGMQPGLTVIVGPPGTGKTDIAVQIIHNIYHNNPLQRTLIVTHSNQALNQLFEKIMILDIDESHLLRLGHGEEALDTDKDFSRYGRVNYVLSRRIALLQEVTRLSKLLGTLGQATVNVREHWKKPSRPVPGGHGALGDSMPLLSVKPTTDTVIRGPTEEHNPNDVAFEIVDASDVVPDVVAAEVPLCTPVILDGTDAADSGPLPSKSSDSVLPYTCETAQHFFLHIVLSRWETFLAEIARLRESIIQPTAYDAVAQSKFRSLFPFMDYFCQNKHGQVICSPDQLFPGKSLASDLAIAQACFLELDKCFRQLDEYRAFELMRTGTERSNYLLVQHAKIIAMTCTHAALRRRDLVKLGFMYDTILMEEAAQILEIETFIPLLLQNPELCADSSQTSANKNHSSSNSTPGRRNRLKRWIMIGDHHQLPPVIKNMAFHNYCNMGQSLFARFVKLGVPTVQLDAQGRARPLLSQLYAWRYRQLRDLPHVLPLSGAPEFRLANPGMQWVYQWINVEDYQGVGESEPDPFFYQNLAEAEYVVALYMYMRLLGYPAERIAILTTYNGQKHLLRDIVNQKCFKNPLFGRPSKVTTVDKFQGQQNDYILLSLVRTRTVGHLRDVRRLVVALSRARLGLYVFGRAKLFAGCHELAPSMSLLLQHPVELSLVSGEQWVDPRSPMQEPAPAGFHRRVDDPIAEANTRTVHDMPSMVHFVNRVYEDRIEWLNQLQKIQLHREAVLAAMIPVATEKTDAGADLDNAEAAETIPLLPIPDVIDEEKCSIEKRVCTAEEAVEEEEMVDQSSQLVENVDSDTVPEESMDKEEI